MLELGLTHLMTGGIPFGTSFEKGFTEYISLGGNFDYPSTDYGSSGIDLKFTAIYLAARGSYHFNNLLKIENNKIDLYGGPSLGYRIFSWNDDSAFLESKYNLIAHTIIISRPKTK